MRIQSIGILCRFQHSSSFEFKKEDGRDLTKYENEGATWTTNSCTAATETKSVIDLIERALRRKRCGGRDAGKEEAEEEALLSSVAVAQMLPPLADVPIEHTLDCRAKNAFHGI